MSNRRLVGPKWPSKDSNPASSKALRNTKEGIDLEFLTVFFYRFYSCCCNKYDTKVVKCKSQVFELFTIERFLVVPQ